MLKKAPTRKNTVKEREYPKKRHNKKRRHKKEADLNHMKGQDEYR